MTGRGFGLAGNAVTTHSILCKEGLQSSAEAERKVCTAGALRPVLTGLPRLTSYLLYPIAAQRVRT